MQGIGIKRLIYKGKRIICEINGHDFYISDVKRIKRWGDSTHAICAFCHTLFKITATYDGIEPGWRLQKIE